MIIKPRIRGFICTTAHPTGCAAHVAEQARYTEGNGALPNAPKKVLVLGASGGYGLASRAVLAFAGRAATIGLSFEKAPEGDRTGSAGWYNNLAFDRLAKDKGLYSESISADAFASETKAQVADLIRRDLGQIDALVYSLASPVRTDPNDGKLYRSAIKPLGEPVHTRTVNVEKGEVRDIDLEPATPDETAATVKVMGGEDWELWVNALAEQNLLAPGFKTLAYTYIGSELTWPIYWHATLGKAKEDLDRAAAALRPALTAVDGDARVAVLKAVVSQASAAIPVVPLYASLLFKVMKEKGLHEEIIAHIDRLFRSRVYGGDLNLDEVGRIRLDEVELRDDIQAEVKRRWVNVNTENVMTLSDLAGFRRDFLKVFGFEIDGVDYEADVDPAGV